MFKKLLSIFLIVFLSLSLSACKPKKPKSIILFNNNPITKETLLNNSTEFAIDKKIYYIFMTEKPFRTDIIRIKIFKRDPDHRNTITGLVYCKDFRLMKDQIYYYNDYVVMQSPGVYCMMVFEKDRLDRPEAVADFKVY